MSLTRVRFLAVLLILIPILGACRPGDPRADALRQRSRFTVELLSWAPRDDGTMSFTVRVSGPPSTSLNSLTFRIAQVDANGDELSSEWRTIDLADVPRGAPKELFYSIDSAGDSVDGLAASIVLNPSDEQIAEIPELRDL